MQAVGKIETITLDSASPKKKKFTWTTTEQRPVKFSHPLQKDKIITSFLHILFFSLFPSKDYK